MINNLETQLVSSERMLLDGLDCPFNIQSFLNTIPYSEDEIYRCPLRVLRDRKGHCFDGAIFAAMALQHGGHPPLILELIPNERDDYHILAPFRKYDHWGAVVLSNFTGLRYREPVYRSLRELVMSYFEDFFQSASKKTLAGYGGPINLKVFDRLEWISSDAGLETLSTDIDRYHVHHVIASEMAASLAPLDERSLRGGLMGANEAGLFKVH